MSLKSKETIAEKSIRKLLDDIQALDDCTKCDGTGKVMSRFYVKGGMAEVEKLCKCVSEQVDKVVELRKALPNL